MAFDGHKNFASSTVATAPSPAASGTSLVVASGDGTKFPSVPFNVTIWPAGAQPTAANAEIARVTVVATDTFTITRTQEGSSARTVIVGDQIAATVTVKTLTDLETGSTGSVSFTADDSFKRVTITDAAVAATSNIAATVIRANTTDGADPGWVYIVNVVSRGTGTFDIVLCALDWDGPVTNTIPNETVTVAYRVWS